MAGMNCYYQVTRRLQDDSILERRTVSARMWQPRIILIKRFLPREETEDIDRTHVFSTNKLTTNSDNR